MPTQASIGRRWLRSVLGLALATAVGFGGAALAQPAAPAVGIPAAGLAPAAPPVIPKPVVQPQPGIPGQRLAGPVDPFSLPKVELSMGGGDGDWVGALRIMGLLTLLTVAPAILLTMTSFTRIIIVFSFLRQAIGTQQSPPNQILVGLALFLTVFIMQPVWGAVYSEALDPYLKQEINQSVALGRAAKPVRDFMFKHTRKKDLSLFISASGDVRPHTKADVATWQLVPAFVLSELKTAFQMGFMVYVPFLVLDMVVASILMAMGMMMLPPILISLPFKIMLFVLVDGWNLMVGSILESFA